ncbi:hypothetical protein FACS1894208_02620 [Clostridia bacterium]|nr:hypothetical protein FACS1894208_02620 [Clostridia bacterium]
MGSVIALLIRRHKKLLIILAVAAIVVLIAVAVVRPILSEWIWELIDYPGKHSLIPDIK